MSISLTTEPAGNCSLPWRVLIRTDASLQMGSGHVMRCLTLADALAARGAQCQFICREHRGHLIDLIRARGFAVAVLPPGTTCSGELAHSVWLGASVAEEIDACVGVMPDAPADWLLVDHYALDAAWEAAMRPYCRRLMVIDDLADRDHLADLLLDQNLGRNAEDYAGRVPARCSVLIGCQFALLRPEFAHWRSASLARDRSLPVSHLVISLGGVDKANYTARVLQLLRNARLPGDCQITVIMGRSAPWVESVKRQASDFPWPCQVLVDVVDMGRLLATADLAIGAAGSSSWERCALGVPSLLLVVADNQVSASQAMERAKVARIVRVSSSYDRELLIALDELLREPRSRQQLALNAARLCDGLGVDRVIEGMCEALG